VNQYRKPDFFIVGAPKCGTTSMYYHLRKHDQIFMPDKKEPHFFGKDLIKMSDEFIDNEDEYLNLFQDAKLDQKLGEASTFYLYSKSAPKEIKEYNPAAKIIIMLRNPIDFLHSLHSQLLFSGNEDELDFEIAIELEEERMKGNKLPENIDMIDKIYYLEHVRRIPEQVNKYLNTFGNENVAVILLDDLHKNPEACFIKILKLLDVDINFTPDFSIQNPNKAVHSFWIRNFIKRYHNDLGKLRGIFYKKPIGIIRYFINRNTKLLKRKPISKVLRNKLMDELNPIVVQLENILHRELKHWKLP